MHTIIFATNNSNKVREVNELVKGQYTFRSLRDIGLSEEIPETTGTIPGNSAQKAQYVHERLQRDVFAEDTGLEVDALNGAPGVDTAIYAGENRDAIANMNKVLRELGTTTDRGAQFRTVITLILDGEQHQFEGICRGTITQSLSGTEGFGYDPIFRPDGHERTFAEMDSPTKNQLSHRGKAMRKLLAFLRERSA